jgi:hypothetical protein
LFASQPTTLDTSSKAVERNSPILVLVDLVSSSTFLAEFFTAPPVSVPTFLAVCPTFTPASFAMLPTSMQEFFAVLLIEVPRSPKALTSDLKLF